MNERASNMTRLHELLADRATQRLTDDEGHELAALLDASPHDGSSFDWAAAALDLSVLRPDDDPLPAKLRARVEADAVAWQVCSQKTP